LTVGDRLTSHVCFCWPGKWLGHEVN